MGWHGLEPGYPIFIKPIILILKEEEIMLRRIASVFCIVLGISILCYPLLEKHTADIKQKQLVEAFQRLGELHTLESEELQDIKNTTEIEEVSDAADKKMDINQEKNILLEDARGVIRIPSIDLEMLIFNKSNEESLEKGIGMIEPEKEFGVNNVGLAGHRSVTYGRRFNRLGEINLQDRIEIQTYDTVYQFEVIKITTVHRTEVSVLEDEEEPLLTLVTCTPLGKKNPSDRLIVQSRLIGKIFEDETIIP